VDGVGVGELVGRDGLFVFEDFACMQRGERGREERRREEKGGV
jgi:hypothetical protein